MWPPPDDLAHWTEIAAPGLPAVYRCHHRCTQNDAQKEKGCSQGPVFHVRHRLGPDDEGKKDKREWNAIFLYQIGRFRLRLNPNF